MRKPLMVMVAALMAIIGFAAPAQAAVSRPFSMAYGNSTTSGTINFTDGYSAPTYGTVHAASDSRRVCAVGVNGGAQTKTYCSAYAVAGGANQPLDAPLRIASQGGVQQVYITMFANATDALAQTVCTRSGCTRQF